MLRRGINYDVGTQTGPYLSRRVFDAAQTRHDLRVIRDNLHCGSVRISGTSHDRLLAATEIALGLGLEVWLSPQLHDGDPTQTLAYTRQCAAAAQALDSSKLVATSQSGHGAPAPSCAGYLRQQTPSIRGPGSVGLSRCGWPLSSRRRP